MFKIFLFTILLTSLSWRGLGQNGTPIDHDELAYHVPLNRLKNDLTDSWDVTFIENRLVFESKQKCFILSYLFRSSEGKEMPYGSSITIKDNQVLLKTENIEISNYRVELIAVKMSDKDYKQLIKKKIDLVLAMKSVNPSKLEYLDRRKKLKDLYVPMFYENGVYWYFRDVTNKENLKVHPYAAHQDVIKLKRTIETYFDFSSVYKAFQF